MVEEFTPQRRKNSPPLGLLRRKDSPPSGAKGLGNLLPLVRVWPDFEEVASGWQEPSRQHLYGGRIHPPHPHDL